MPASNARVPTPNASRYLQQLCKHWSHKLELDYTPQTARITMPSGAVVTLDAGAEALEIGIVADTDEGVEQVKGVIERHLDRFAFREMPLAYGWSA